MRTHQSTPLGSTACLKTAVVLGMNFEMAFFGSERGFWITLAAMIVLSAAAWWLASRKRWA